MSTISKGTVDAEEIKHFKELASKWWDLTGPTKGLHSMNSLRVPLIPNRLREIGVIPSDSNTSTPLTGLSILDVGCGGGLMTEPLARMGANVTGLDANEDLIEIAKEHMKNENFPQLQYVFSTIEEFASNNKEKYDIIVSSETVEHVTEKEDFLKGCIQCLKPGGSIFITTNSKTWTAAFAAIFLGEYVLRFIPRGSHEYKKFIEPRELEKILAKENCKTVFTHGMIYNPFSDTWSWTKYDWISYALHAVKNHSQ